MTGLAISSIQSLQLASNSLSGAPVAFLEKGATFSGVLGEFNR